MKKFISVLSALILSAAAMPMCAAAEGDTGLPPKEDSTEAVIVPDYVSGTYENLNYRQYSDHVVVEGRYDVKGDIVIPSEVNGLPVTELGSFELSGITSVVIPDSVKKIGNFCFYFTNIKSIVLPDSVTIIGDNAFSGCGKLESIEIPDSVEKIGMSAFFGCRSLESVTIPKNTEISLFTPIFDSDTKTVVKGYKDSFAYNHAKKYNVKFVYIDNGYEYLLGDTDSDGVVDASDASRTLEAYAMSLTGSASNLSISQTAAADANGDSTVNSVDASYILNYYSHALTGGNSTFEKFIDETFNE
ncbi:MAG: leucine-rich repeat protein [Ruminococcus sp.]|nr:leucine-rich repeat protein [Ruminococcus sp.]